MLCVSSNQSVSLSFLPYLTGGVLLGTATVTHAIARFTTRKHVGLSLLCKSGGKPPAKYVFICGFLFSSVLIGITGNLASIPALVSSSLLIRISGWIQLCMGWISAGSLAGFATISVYDNETWHNTLAYSFAFFGMLFEISAAIAKSSATRVALVSLNVLFILVMLGVAQFEYVMANGMNSPTGFARSRLVSAGPVDEPYSPQPASTGVKVWSALQFFNIMISAGFLLTFVSELSQFSIVFSTT